MDSINTENSRNNFHLAGQFLEACYKFLVSRIWKCILCEWKSECV